MARENSELFRFLGQVDRRTIFEHLMSADVFCLPSEDESQGITLLEAGHFGIPMALTALPPYRGIWEHGVNCLLSPVKDPAMLAWSLRALLDDASLAQRLGASGKAVAERHPIVTFLKRFDAVVDGMFASNFKRPAAMPRYMFY
jgi:glycosyltransferase involved in cell wall biosynthesis